MKTIVERINKPTPGFFKKLRNTGLAIAAIGTAVLTAPVLLPAIILKVAGYLTVAGTVMSGVSQTAVKNERQ